MSLQSCSLIQDRKILSHVTRNLLCSLSTEFESKIDSQSQDSSLDAKTIHQFLLVLLDLFLRSKVFSILQLFGNLSFDFLGRVYFSIEITHTNLFHLFERDLPIDSLVEAEIVGIDLIKSHL